jgi:cytoskeletal protein CcmA (bactofilin family)
MADIGVDTLVVPGKNGERDTHAPDPPVTTIAKDDSLSGRLQIKGDGCVLGSFSGRIDCDGDLMIGSDARVEADIHGSRVTIAGFVRGNIVAEVRLKIATSGRLEGDARVGALVVQEGGVHHGVIRVHPEGIPDSVDEVITDAAPRPMSANLKSLPNPVGRVRKFWGEFF